MSGSFISLFLLAFAVSLDGLGTGITYGLRRVKIPAASLLVISSCSGIFFYISMKLGAYLAKYLSSQVSEFIGAFILICIGLWAVVRLFFQTQQGWSNSVRWLKISFLETMSLAIALSLDSFGTGLSAALFGHPALITSLVIAFVGGVILWLGFRIGHFISELTWMKPLTAVPGCLLIALGILKILH